MNYNIIIKNFFNDYFFYRKLFRGLIRFIVPNDKLCVSLQYRIMLNKRLDLNNPKSFNEKIQWLKLYDRRPEYTVYVDKYKVRDYIAKTIGKKYLIPLLGVWNTPDEIDFNKLPNQFVLKCNHDSGGICICSNKSTFDIKSAKKKLRKSLDTDYYLRFREWPYKNVSRKIIAEQYMEDELETLSLRDYKFLCFDGKVKCCFVCSDRNTKEGLHVTFFDSDWNVLPFERHYPARKEGLPKPKCYEEMVMLAEKLSKAIPFVRVDFYEIKGKVYFGELTLYPGSGFEEFTPRSADEWLGDFIKLPKPYNAN